MDIKYNRMPVLVTCKPYGARLSERNYINQIVKQWKESRIVTEIRSSCSSHICLVIKKSDEAFVAYQI